MRTKKIIIIAISVVIILILTLCIVLLSKNTISKCLSKHGVIEAVNDFSLVVDKDNITNESIKITIYNHTNEDTSYGVNYEIEQWEEGRWKSFDVQANWIEIACILKANSSNTETISWQSVYGRLAIGKYRMIKNVAGTIISDEFEIK
ncbi:MAG: hypothetical protein PHP54_04535 [Clostridia bacterium]|nr:hypothetical protein [Clostridia bacterium]